MANVIKINENLNEQKTKVAARIAKNNEKKRIKDSLTGKTFAELSNSEKDDLLKFVAIKLNLIEE